MLVLVSQVLAKKDVSLDVFWKWLKTQLFELRSGGHSTSWTQSRKRSVRVIWYLFGMAPQGVVHLQNASFWRAHKFELASLGILVQCQLWSCRQTSVPWIWCEWLLVASVTWWREVWWKHWLGTSAYVKRDLFNVITYYVKSSQNRARWAFVFIKHIHFFFFFFYERSFR